MLAAIKHLAAEIIYFFRKTANHCIVHATYRPSSCCSKIIKYIAHELHPHAEPDRLHKTSIFLLQREHKLWVNMKIEKNKQIYWQKVLEV